VGARSFLSLPKVYDFFQDCLGARKSRAAFVREYLRPWPKDRLLDMGCGTADLLNYLPDVRYVGFDPSERYIRAAKRQHGAKAADLFCADLADIGPDRFHGSFDIVVAAGVLHHLPDDEVQALGRLARALLRPGGRLVTLDPCFHAGQSRVARFLVSKDRGHFVRTPEAYRRLLAPVFPELESDVREDLLNVPYSHCYFGGRVPA
jgi:SAM-dependent methyltransferase